ncbi:MAG: protein-L-isoaspartate O-methyltransferase [Candidatus Hadarchaeales archaeon]
MFDEEKEELVNRLINCGYLRSKKVIDAFRKVPRHEFVHESLRNSAYTDQPLPVGYGQTISAPSMIAIMMESLDFRKNQRVLEIGTGSGYNAALIAEVVGKKGLVVTIERIKELAKRAEQTLADTGYENVRVLVGDGTCGYEDGAPWDRIIVTACAPRIPQPLVKQLADRGKIGVPVGEQYAMQTWTVGEKKSGELKISEHGGCSFVPLVGKYGWPEE